MYCAYSGHPLTVVGDYELYSCVAYRCPDASCGRSFLAVADLRWTSCFIELQRGVVDRLLAAPGELVHLAFQRIRRIDHLTVSLLGFEHTLLGVYDPARMARIVYPDGSES